MKINYTLFHPYYLLKKNYNPIFYRCHIDFLLNLLKFIIIKKQFFLINQAVFFDFIIKYFNDYNATQFYKKDNYNFFLNIIDTIKYIKKNKNYNLYTYITTLIGTMLYFGCYNIGILSLTNKSECNKNDIKLLVNKVLEKYKYTPKIIFITINQQLKKGIILRYKDVIIDLSLKKLYELLNNKITINNIGEL